MMQAICSSSGEFQSHVDGDQISFERILARGLPFTPAQRISITDDVELRQEVERICVEQGRPLVIEGFHQLPQWKQDLFSFSFLKKTHGNDGIVCRDLRSAEDVLISMSDYIKEVHPAALDECILISVDIQYVITGADLGNVKAHLAAENLLVYIGQGGTWTPAHLDQCGAIGHNIMPWADDDSSSIWFLVATGDKAKAEALWKSFGHPLEYEGYFASVEELACADFPIYVIEQKIGDFVLVPSQSYHQVFNLGRASIKIAWNRLTSQSLKASVDYVLPRYREIGRPEGYRISLVIKSNIEAFRVILQKQSSDLTLPVDDFIESFNILIGLFRTIIEEEWVDMGIMDYADTSTFKRPKRLANMSPATCDYCRSDIWNRQYQCTLCKNEDGDSYDICTRCVSLGRGCVHRATRSLEFIENFSMKSCVELHNDAIDAWNNSTVLQGHSGYSRIDNPWIKGFAPLGDKGFSFASLAFKRKHSKKRRRRACHICKQRSMNLMSVICLECQHHFCESCLLQQYDQRWDEIETKREGWTCPMCKDRPHLNDCGDLEGQRLPSPCSKSDREALLVFTNPDEDERNRGGISDEIRKDFIDEEQPRPLPEPKQGSCDESKMEIENDGDSRGDMETSHNKKSTTRLDSKMLPPGQEQEPDHDVSEMDTREFQLPTDLGGMDVFAPEFKEMLDFLHNSKFQKTLEALEQSSGQASFRTKIYKTDRILGTVGGDVQKIFRNEVLERVLDARKDNQGSGSSSTLATPFASIPGSSTHSRSASKGQLARGEAPKTIKKITLTSAQFSSSQAATSSNATAPRRLSSETPTWKSLSQTQPRYDFRHGSEDPDPAPSTAKDALSQEKPLIRRKTKRKIILSDEESIEIEEHYQKTSKRPRRIPEMAVEKQSEKKCLGRRPSLGSTYGDHRSSPPPRMNGTSSQDGMSQSSFMSRYEFRGNHSEKPFLPPIPRRARGRPRKLTEEMPLSNLMEDTSGQTVGQEDSQGQRDVPKCAQADVPEVDMVFVQTVPSDEVNQSQDMDQVSTQMSIDSSAGSSRNDNVIDYDHPDISNSLIYNGPTESNDAIDNSGGSGNGSQDYSKALETQGETPRRRLRIERTRYIEISIGSMLSKTEEPEVAKPVHSEVPSVDQEGRSRDLIMDTSQKTAAQETIDQEITGQKNTSQEIASQEIASQVIGVQGSVGQEGTSQGITTQEITYQSVSEQGLAGNNPSISSTESNSSEGSMRETISSVSIGDNDAVQDKTAVMDEPGIPRDEVMEKGMRLPTMGRRPSSSKTSGDVSTTRTTSIR
ncbi:hypothetical protein BGW38_000979, partial [Lunasporangiospora selenospora]